MPQTDIIKSYLVRLGFDVDGAQVYKFEATLHRAGVAAERVVRNMTGDFIRGGTAIVGALAGIATGTIALMEHVSQADLGYKLFARRMFMTEDAAKKLKIATDSLGYSLEEIIWGPPELAERYRALILDQERLLKNLGGADFDKQMRRLRDIRFEFTEIGVSVKYLGMDIVRHLAHTILGDDDGVRDKIRGWNEWLMNNLDKIASRIATDLAPLVKSLGELIGSIFTQDHLDMMLKWFDKLTQGLTMTIGLVNQLLHGGSKDPTAAAGGIWDKSKSFTDNMNTLIPGALGILPSESSKDEIIGKIIAGANARGIDVAHALALFQQESGFNPNSQGPRITNPNSAFFGQRALGLGQIMPGNAPGKNLMDPDTNIQVTLDMLQRLLGSHGGDWRQALNDYYGRGTPMPGQPTFDQYFEQFQQKEKGFEKEWGPGAKPISMRIDVGGVTVHATNTNASAQEIADATVQAINEKMSRATQRTIAQFQGAFA